MILITGASGYVGSHTVRRLAEQGAPVRAMVRDFEKARSRLGDLANRIDILKGDVGDPVSLEKAMAGVSTVVHLVAIAIEKHGQTYDEINHQGTVNVVDAAVRAGVGRFINMSQNGADSAVPYRFLKSKGRAQDYVAAHAPRWTALCPSVIFGHEDEFFNSIAGLMKLTPLLFPDIGLGRALFQPVSVHDVAEAVVRSIGDDGTIGRKLELGGPEVLTLGEIERRIHRTVGGWRIFIPAPVWLLRAPVFLMERLLPGSPVTSSLLELLAVPNVVGDNALVSHFRMQPRPFSGEHIAYLRQNTARRSLKKLFGA